MQAPAGRSNLVEREARWMTPIMRVGRSRAAYDRLIELGELFRPLTQRMLLAAGITRGMHVLDFGCGRRCQHPCGCAGCREGSVVGVDLDTDCPCSARAPFWSSAPQQRRIAIIVIHAEACANVSPMISVTQYCFATRHSWQIAISAFRCKDIRFCKEARL